MDCGDAGAAAAVGEEGFLVWAGACAQAEEPALATDMTKPKKADRARKGMRLVKSSGLRIPRERARHKSGIGAKTTEASARGWRCSVQI